MLDNLVYKKPFKVSINVDSENQKKRASGVLCQDENSSMGSWRDGSVKVHAALAEDPSSILSTTQ